MSGHGGEERRAHGDEEEECVADDEVRGEEQEIGDCGG